VPGVAGTNAAIGHERAEFGAFAVTTLASRSHPSTQPREEFSTTGRFACIPRPRSLLARLVRIVNTAILGQPQSF
jgi:hypothetical protein